jgi:hypothetical protein
VSQVDDFPAIAPQVDDDEEERKRRALAIQPATPAPRASALPPIAPVAPPEPAPTEAPKMPAVAPSYQPNFKDAMSGTIGVPPNPKDFHPPKRSIWNRIAAGGAGLSDPRAGIEIAEEPARQAHQAYTDASTAYNQRFNQALQTNAAEQEAPLKQAQTREANVNADVKLNPQVKPKEENWKVVPGVQGPNGEPMQEEQNSGQMRVAPGGASVTEKNAKPSEVDKDVSDYLASKGLPNTPANREKARESRAARDRPPAQGSFMPLYGKDGQVVGAWNPANGQVQHAPALPGTTAAGVGQQDKAAAAVDKKIAPYKAVVDEAEQAAALKDMGDKGNAEADVGLALTFFKAMRSGTTGGSGIRFTQQENNLIMNSRNLWGTLEVKGNQLLSNGQPLSREQRKEIFDVSTVYRDAAQRHIQEAQGGGPQGGGTPPSGGGGGGKVLVEGKDF